ncbi:hypothetical protein PMAYCL1PPCAC_09478, partial [Pristionchus mayeri]
FFACFMFSVDAIYKRAAEERVGEEDRLMVVCEPKLMIIIVKRDFFAFELASNASGCTPLFFRLREYLGSYAPIYAWELPLTNSRIGKCGMEYGQVPDSQLWAHTITMFGPDRPRIVRCTDAGGMSKSGVRIRLRQGAPELKDLIADENGIVEVPRRSTITASFEHDFHKHAGISLHPIRCWIINEKRDTKMDILENGCPIFKYPNDAIASLGAASASNATSSHVFLVFNVDKLFYQDDDLVDFQTFRLECDVVPCKGEPLFEQVIGVERVSHNFSLRISSSSIPDGKYQALNSPIVVTYYSYDYKDEDEEDKH